MNGRADRRKATARCTSSSARIRPGAIKKIIDVTPEMAEWKVTLPPMKAGPKPHTLKVHFTIDGEMVHERVIPGIVFGDVWCVVAPAGTFKVPEVTPSGQIVRMIENQSNRDGRADPSRFSICISRTPRYKEANGKWSNRLASYWKDADGLAAALGNSLSAKDRPSGRHHLHAEPRRTSRSRTGSPRASSRMPRV